MADRVTPGASGPGRAPRRSSTDARAQEDRAGKEDRAGGRRARRSRGRRPAEDHPLGVSGPFDEQAMLELLAGGALEVAGRLMAASNATLLCTVRLGDTEAACVYKPVAGERPLWDFPPGSLAGREVAAYMVSRVAGWDIVPPTVHRDGPFGPGMCQLWIDADTGSDLVALARSRTHRQLRDMAVFDAVVNNADRKIGHLLPMAGGRLYGCDHGVCFGEEYKLRTVLWQWRGEALPERCVSALTRLAEELDGGSLATELAGLLSAREVRATRQRIGLLIKHRVHPYPPENWPAVPWPPV